MIEPKNSLDAALPLHAVACVTIELMSESQIG